MANLEIIRAVHDCGAELALPTFHFVEDKFLSSTDNRQRPSILNSVVLAPRQPIQDSSIIPAISDSSNNIEGTV